MDVNDFFRRFFGFHKMPPDGFNHPFSRRFDVFENDEGFEDPHDSDGTFHDDDFSSVFRNMENVFNGMFSIHPGFLDFPNLEMAPAQENPRDLMLKSPDAQQCENCMQPTVIDITNQRPQVDLGERHNKSNVGMHQEQDVFAPKPVSFIKSFSSRIVRTGNGVVEEHHTSTNSSGETVTTVKKSLGDQTYQVVTQSDKSGLVEKKEDFINIDEKDISDFEDKLKQQKRNMFGFLSGNPNQGMLEPSNFPVVEQPLRPPMPEDPIPPGDPLYRSIFKKLFG